MTDCRLTNAVRKLLENPQAEIHSEVAVRIGLEVFKVKRDGSTELLFTCSRADAPKLSFYYPDLA